MKHDIYQKITDQIIEAMEKGAAPWRKSWDAGNLGFPLRSTGEHYKGINVLVLWCAAQSKGYASDYWFTYKQSKELGAMVRKGEKSTTVVYYNTKAVEDKNTGQEVKIPFLRSYPVFNGDQIDGLPDQFSAERVGHGTTTVPEFEAFFAATGADIRTRGNRPCYIPALDCIEMPPISSFESADKYFGVLSQTGHWTGHKSRLDRVQTQQRKEYAFEELIGEITSVLICLEIGATPDFDQSAAYLTHWLKALKDDKKFIFQAAGAAQRATDYICELVTQNQTKKEAA